MVARKLLSCPTDKKQRNFKEGNKGKKRQKKKIIKDINKTTNDCSHVW